MNRTKKNYFIACVNQNREPFPGSDSTPIRPPNCSTILLHIDKPNPVPWAKLFNFTNRSKIVFCFSGSIPIPVSVTETSTSFPFKTDRTTISPEVVNLKELFTKIDIT